MQTKLKKLLVLSTTMLALLLVTTQPAMATSLTWELHQGNQIAIQIKALAYQIPARSDLIRAGGGSPAVQSKDITITMQGTELSGWPWVQFAIESGKVQMSDGTTVKIVDGTLDLNHGGRFLLIAHTSGPDSMTLRFLGYMRVYLMVGHSGGDVTVPIEIQMARLAPDYFLTHLDATATISIV